MPNTIPSKTVLIIDDNRDFADTLAMLLTHYGHKPMTCYDAETALRVAEQQRPDVILLDVGLPGTDGYDIARQFRCNGIFAKTVIMAVTGHATERERRLAHGAGFDLHFRKPINLDDLSKILKHTRSATLV